MTDTAIAPQSATAPAGWRSWRPGWRTALVAVAVLPIVVATVRALARGWVAIGDNGLILLRTEDVFTRDTPLLGSWTSASLSVGQDLNNPGPLLYDLLAPFTRLGGPNVGFAVGMMAINIGAVAVATWAARRAGGDRALVVVTMLSAGLAWSMGSELLFDVWQPNAMVLPFWALLVVLWALGTGDLVMAPIAAGLGSLVAQTHLSFVYVIAVGGLVGIAGAWWSRRAERPGGLRPLRRPLVATAVVVVLAWIQPLVDQVAGEGNLGALLTAGRGDGQPIGLALGARLVAGVVALPPWWARPGYAETIPVVPLVDGDLDTSGITGRAAAAIGLLLVVALLVAAVTRGRRRGDRPTVVLAALAGACLAACLASMVLSPLNTLGLTSHQMRWLWPVSALVSAAVLVAAAAELRTTRVVEPLAAAATAIIVVLTLPTYVAGAGPTAERAYTDSIAGLVDQLEEYRPGAPVLLDDTGTRFIEPYSGPAFAALARAGVDVRASREGIVRQIGRHRRADGTERFVLSIREGDLARDIPPGATRIAYYDPLEASEQQELADLRSRILARATTDGLRLNAAGLAAAERGDIGFAETLVPPGGDGTELEASGWIGILAANDWLVVDDAEREAFARYGELSSRQDMFSVAVFATPVG